MRKILFIILIWAIFLTFLVSRADITLDRAPATMKSFYPTYGLMVVRRQYCDYENQTLVNDFYLVGYWGKDCEVVCVEWTRPEPRKCAFLSR